MIYQPKSKAIIFGIPLVWGVPKTHSKIVGIPRGAKVRLRFRNNDFGRAFVRNANGKISSYVIVERRGKWILESQYRQAMNTHLKRKI